MIGNIRGILMEKQPPEILIEAGGVGYEVQVPMTSFYQLPEIGQEANLCIHFVVREDAQLLFGFANKQERAINKPHYHHHHPTTTTTTQQLQQ